MSITRFLFATGLVLLVFIVSELFKFNYAIVASTVALLMVGDSRVVLAVVIKNCNDMFNEIYSLVSNKDVKEIDHE
jgi:hypothetical protein